ncbi:MAG: ATP-binding protein [Bradyrhizobium sp.]|uniref:ATP-binding protein n=1 Tax=Bradyrhizobium sp. TaxID=376 RepID=UPI001C2978BE|nr:ATP-binding protein [Bradyrhizobium sp.]MBU6461293.1 ATP-binding protein [Pseudomonadota bacterium]MDE2065774.1 ATP-binding protein [Bradyrhizobium sp.]MDE2242837.1 ATP-binding protein [Bradyrhizobium sp.]MDE2472334.1 ATP-binding protein [Bradyrhizobium sp.]
MVVLTLKAKHDHLQKVASTHDHVKAISEFVWNALDADAKRTSVEFERNPLGGLVSIIIRDNGTGISKARAEHDFESLGESWKRTNPRTPILARAIHGKEGQGRLRFFSLSQRAHWDSVYEEDKTLLKLTIDIDADRLEISNVSEPARADADAKTGTVVQLTPLKGTFDWLVGDEARSEFDSIFAPYILQYPDAEIIYDDKPVDPNRTIERSHEFPKQAIICPGRVVKDLTLRVIEWKPRITARKIYFGGESGVVLGSLPANVPAPEFVFSAYAYTPFFNEIAEANLLEFDGLTDPDFARVLEYVRDTLTDYFRVRQAEKSGELIQELKDAGVYPYEGEPKDEVERHERQVFDITTHAVASYSRDFKKADNPLKKITLGLLREAVKNNPESVSRILKAVFNLPKVRQDEFSQLLEKTELGNIIAASNLVANRVVALKVLKEIVFEPKHRRTIKERGELDVLVRDNTWLFGEGFHFTMAEAGLTKIMRRVSEELSLKRAKGTKGRKPDGKIGRIDSFMGRLVPHGDVNHREFLLIELKRPSLVIGRKELDQLEDYVTSILAQPDFLNTSTSWNFYLVTSEYDDVVKERITQENRPAGLFIDKANHRVWVKSWAELLRDAEGRLKFVQDQLRIEVSAEEIERRIAELKASVLKSEALDLGDGSGEPVGATKKIRTPRSSASGDEPTQRP